MFVKAMDTEESSQETKSPIPLSVLKRNWRSLFIVKALAIDSAAIVCSNVLAFNVHDLLAANMGHVLPPVVRSTVLLCCAFIFFGLVLGLYRAAYHTKIQQQYFIGARVYLYSSLVILALLFIARQVQYSRLYLVLFFTFLPLFFLAFRMLLNWFTLRMQKWGFGVSHALVVEYDHRFDEVLVNRFTSFPELGYRVHDHIVKRKTDGKNPVKHELSKLGKLVSEKPVDTIFIPTLDIMENGYSELIEFCQARKIKLKVLSKESDDLLRFAYVKDLAGISLSTPPRRKTAFIKKVTKRIFDVVVSIATILLLTPVFVIVSLAIMFEDGRPILYKQRRALTKGGKPFLFLKFRSMEIGAEEKQQDLYKVNKTTGGLFLIHDDPRLTKVGRIIRRFSIDELPQLFNVLVGDMSLVGPRPLTTGDLTNITPQNRMGGYYTLRGKAKPGMTGLWQICGRREVGFREMVLLDLYYIENQTILFDLEILVQTIPVVLFGRGAY